jgi:hypothetical protein
MMIWEPWMPYWAEQYNYMDSLFYILILIICQNIHDKFI